MSQFSKIQWTTHTFNPWIGCTKVSPGCAHCYAETQDRFRRWTPEGWGKGKARRRTAESTWNQVLNWDRKAIWEGSPGRTLVFSASLADWLDPEVPAKWLGDFLRLIAATPNLTWLLLTKRPELFQARMELAMEDRDFHAWELMDAWWKTGHKPHNVWVGTTIEDQQRADERLPHLHNIPAMLRFVSFEPLLEEVFIPEEARAVINWWIVGGESGKEARYFDHRWALVLQEQAASVGAAFFMKQLGANNSLTGSGKNDNPNQWPELLQVREFPWQKPWPK